MADHNEPPTIIPDINQIDNDDYEDDLFKSTVENMSSVSLDDAKVTNNEDDTFSSDTPVLNNDSDTEDVNVTNNDTITGDNAIRNGTMSSLTKSDSMDSFSDKEDLFTDMDIGEKQINCGSLTVMNDEDEIQSQNQVYTSIEESTVEMNLKEDDTKCSRIEIVVTEPRKMGDGMNAYVAYKITTKTSLPSFNRTSMVVYRRFSDFLGLREQLADKYQTRGYIVPPAPEKSVIGMTKIKINKDESSVEFIEKRRAALERYLNRTAKNPHLLDDAAFISFLQLPDALPKSTSTSTLSGASVLRLFGKMGDSLSKIAFRMEETDQISSKMIHAQWFEDKTHEINELEAQINTVLSAANALVSNRKNMSVCTGYLGKEIAILGASEEITSLSRALSQFAELQEHIELLHSKCSEYDFYTLHELIKDYSGMISAIKSVFHEREKSFRLWKDTDNSLQKKQDQRLKLESARKMDKIPSLSQEITILEMKLEQSEREFSDISKNIRIELRRFDSHRTKEFKDTMIRYIEALINNQNEVVSKWTTFLSEARAIS